MKKMLAVMLSACVALSFVGCSSAKEAEPTSKMDQIKAAGKLVMATSPDYPPYEFKDLTNGGEGEIVGSDIEMAKKVAEALGVELVIEEMEFSTILNAVNAGDVDIALSGFTYKDERAESFNMCGPFHTEGDQTIMVLASDTTEYQSVNDFSGKLVGAQNGSIQQGLVSGIEGANVELFPSISDGILLLKSGKIDALAIAETAAGPFIKTDSDLRLTGVIFEDYKPGLYAIVHKDETEFAEFVTEVVVGVNDTGAYEEWVAEFEELAEKLAVAE